MVFENVCKGLFYLIEILTLFIHLQIKVVNFRKHNIGKHKTVKRSNKVASSSVRKLIRSSSFGIPFLLRYLFWRNLIFPSFHLLEWKASSYELRLLSTPIYFHSQLISSPTVTSQFVSISGPLCFPSYQGFFRFSSTSPKTPNFLHAPALFGCYRRVTANMFALSSRKEPSLREFCLWRCSEQIWRNSFKASFPFTHFLLF